MQRSNANKQCKEACKWRIMKLRIEMRVAAAIHGKARVEAGLNPIVVATKVVMARQC
jgi:hypothetical protein